MSRYPLDAFAAEIAGIPLEDDPATVRLRSRDRFAVSPMLRQRLKGKHADIIVTPRTKEEVARILKAAVRHRIPVTPRGGGTANFGQSVPLEGGILLNLTALTGIVWQRPGTVRVMAGTLIADMDEATRPNGWEQRIHPSTKRSSAIAGFVSGGHAGIGSCTWGMLRDRGNVLAVEIMSMEEESRVIELRGTDVNLVHHAYGTNGIVTEVEMPTAPAWPWREVVTGFPDLPAAARFAVALGHEDGLIRKLISLQEWPLPSLNRPFAPLVPDGHSLVNAIVAPQSMEGFADLVRAHGGTVLSDAAEGEGPYGAPLYEFSWGHSLLHVQKTEPSLTAVMGLFPPDGLADAIIATHRRFGAAGPLRLELERVDGRLVAMGSPTLRYESEAQVAAMVRDITALGAQVANSHSFNVKGVGVKQLGGRDAAFKRVMDPHGLLNPGKISFEIREEDDIGTRLPTGGWSFTSQAGAGPAGRPS